MELPEIYAMADAGDEDLLTESERAQLPPSPPESKSSFNENLAERLDSQTLGRLAQDVHDGYDSDDASRSGLESARKSGFGCWGSARIRMESQRSKVRHLLFSRTDRSDHPISGPYHQRTLASARAGKGIRRRRVVDESAARATGRACR